MHVPVNRAVPRRRWGIAVLLGASVLFNYFDRLALSVAGPPLKAELHLDALTLGVLFSAFSGPTPCCNSRSARISG